MPAAGSVEDFATAGVGAVAPSAAGVGATDPGAAGAAGAGSCFVPQYGQNFVVSGIVFPQCQQIMFSSFFPHEIYKKGKAAPQLLCLFSVVTDQRPYSD